MPERERAEGRTKWVVFTVVLELRVEEPKEKAELRGYNWLARRLKRVTAPDRELELLSFNTVPVSGRDFAHMMPGTGAEAMRKLYGYLVRLRNGVLPGSPAPEWLTSALAVTDSGDVVLFRGITAARPVLLTGRT